MIDLADAGGTDRHRRGPRGEWSPRRRSSRFLVTWPALVFALWGISLALLADQRYAIPPFEDATPAEQRFFDAKLQQFQAHQHLIPAERRVDDMISAFETQLTQTTNCPGDDGRRLTVRINSELNKWNHEIVNSQVAGRENVIGVCIAQYSFLAKETGAIDIDMNLHLMLDTSATLGREQDLALGGWLNESLVYHELLHCELLIKAIKSAPSWTAKACQHEVDLAPLDPSHLTIYPWVEDFLERLVSTAEGTFTLRLPPQDRDGADGVFDLDLGKISKLVGKRTRVSSQYMLPASSNLVFDPSADPALPRFEYPKNGRVHFKGKMIDPGKAGFVLIRIVPYSEK